MLTLLYVLFVSAFAYVSWQAFRVYHVGRSSYALLLLFVLVGLVYDTLTILIGRFVGEGEALKSLNGGRYLVHALVTPALIIFAFGVLRNAGIPWAQTRASHTIVCVFATLLIAIGVYEDVFALDLRVREVAGTVRYVNEGGMKGPPIPAMLSIFFLIGAGLVLWRRTGWLLLAAGSLFMLIAAGVGTGDRFYLGNLGEIALSAVSVLTARRFLSRQPEIHSQETARSKLVPIDDHS